AIFYIGPRQMLTETPVSAEGTFATGTPRNLFPIRGRAPISSSDLFTYDVALDGKRFLVNQYVRPEQPAPLNVVLHESGSASNVRLTYRPYNFFALSCSTIRASCEARSRAISPSRIICVSAI